MHSTAALRTFVSILKVRIAASSAGFPQTVGRFGCAWVPAIFCCACQYFHACTNPAVRFLDHIVDSSAGRTRFVRSRYKPSAVRARFRRDFRVVVLSLKCPRSPSWTSRPFRASETQRAVSEKCGRGPPVVFPPSPLGRRWLPGSVLCRPVHSRVLSRRLPGLIKRDNFLARPATQLHPRDIDDDSGEPRGQLRAALEAANVLVGG